eukprot:COSAG01_NODE_2422_length_7726_cov_5.781172_1_plen_184_part_00
MSSTFDRSRYYTYAEVDSLLHGWADAWPGVCQLESVGKSGEGRELWLLTITAGCTDDGVGGVAAAAAAKPALWVDGNTHAGEVTGCTAALDFAHTLLASHADGDEATAKLLHDAAFYVLPRICPDGAELYLTTPLTCRSTPRLFPDLGDTPKRGFRVEDLDRVRVLYPLSEGIFVAGALMWRT